MTTSGIKQIGVVILFILIILNEINSQRFATYTSTDCGNFNLKFGIKGGLEFCEGDTITLKNSTDSTFDYYIIDWSEGKLDTVYDKRDAYHVYYFPDSVLCAAKPLAVYFMGVKECKNGKQTRVWGAYGINHIYRPLAEFGVELDSVCFGHNICMKSHACNADSIVYNYNGEYAGTDSCYSFSTSGTKQITMIAFNKCASDTITKSFTISDYPSAKVNISSNVKNNSVCKGDTIAFFNASNSWSHSKWTFPPVNDKIWKLDTSISNLEYEQPYDTIIYLDTIRFVVLDTGTLKFRLLSTNACDSIYWDYKLQVVDSAIIQFDTLQHFCESADFTPRFNIIGAVNKYNWSFPGGNPSNSLSPNPSHIKYGKPGKYTVILTASNSCGSSTDSTFVYVDSKPLLRIDTAKKKFCQSDQAFNLNANIPNGIWSGTGVDVNGLFNPSGLNPGSYKIFYTLQSGACIASDSIILQVVDTVPVTITPVTLCINSSSVLLNANPPGGKFSGFGISSFGEFDPFISGAGIFPVQYYYVDSNGCKSEATTDIQVNPPPQILKKDTLNICIGVGNINLLKELNCSANPGGGQFSFSINGKTVNPIINSSNYKLGIYKVAIYYKLNLCNSVDSAILRFIDSPILKISNDTILCDRSGIFRLQANFTGGTWSGPAINPLTGLVDLRGIGADTAKFKYTYSAGANCDATAECTIIIDDKGYGVLAGKDISICKDTNRFYKLTSATPVGGTWLGIGVVNDTAGLIELDQLMNDSNYTFKYCFLKPVVSPCTFCDSLKLTVHSLPTADFNIVGSACLDDSFHLENHSLNANSYFWDFGDGTTSILKEPDHKYIDTGLHVLKLTVINSSGCNSIMDRTIFVSANTPKASFSMDSTSTCAPFQIKLKNQSSGDLIRSQWNIAGIKYIDSLPILIVDHLTKDSTFKIELIVDNGCGIDVDSSWITVHPYPVINFGIDSFSGCTPLELNFSNISTGQIDQYKWDMGNGNVYTNTNPPKQIYTTNDSTITKYQIKLYGSNLCGIDSLTKEITVYPPNVSAFIEIPQTRICQYDSMTLQSFSTPGSKINWKIIDPKGLSYSSNQISNNFYFNLAGQYVLILHAFNCGEDYDTAYVQVSPAPVVDFDFPAILCLNDTAFFKNTSIDISASDWDFGDSISISNHSIETHPFHKYSQPGTYTVSLKGYSILNNCVALIQKEIIVIGAPNAEFGSDVISGCVPLTIHFIDKSKGATRYNWSFSDNSSNSTEKSPTHVFNNPGTYKIVLQVLDTNQCFSDTAVLIIKTNPSPVSAFQTDKSMYCLGKDSIHLTNASSNAITYEWMIGNTSSKEVNPVIRITDTGKIIIRLISTNVFGCTDTSLNSVIVLSSPIAAFSSDIYEGCEDLHIQLNNESLFSRFYVWDFGDKNNSTIPSPDYLYKDPGKYFVQLISISSNGCPSDTARHLIEVWPLPNADFEIQKDSLCGVPMHMRFINNSLNASNYNWSLNGKKISNSNETEYTFDATGNYQIGLVVLSDHGCKDSLTKEISIYEKPIADFIADNKYCAGAELHIHNLSRKANSYDWSFGKLGNSNEFEPKITLWQAGVFDISLIASNNAVCSDTILKTGFLNVYEQPEADFDFVIDAGTRNTGEVDFINHSKYYNSQKWFFGDGFFSNLDNPVHYYAINQNNRATLFVYNNNNGNFICLDSISKNIGPIWITTFYAPNALSPEYGEQEVRWFKPVGIGLETYEMSVYSPWGERVWYSNALTNHAPTEAWDGRYQGSLVPQGAYTWMAKITFINGNKKIVTGTVTVLR